MDNFDISVPYISYILGAGGALLYSIASNTQFTHIVSHISSIHTGHERRGADDGRDMAAGHFEDGH